MNNSRLASGTVARDALARIEEPKRTTLCQVAARISAHAGGLMKLGEKVARKGVAMSMRRGRQILERHR